MKVLIRGQVLVAVLALVVLVGCAADPAPEVAEPADGSAEADGLLSAAASTAGWSVQGEPMIYVGDTLYELINGGAELYHQHGFVQALAAEYANESGNEIALEVFEMGRPEGAHEVFLSKAGETGESVEIGDEARLESYYMNVRVGRFLATITGFDSEPETAAGVLEIGRAVAGKLGGLK